MHNTKIWHEKGVIKNWNTGMLTQTQLSQIRFYAKMDHVKMFQNIVRTITFSDFATFQLAEDGIKIIIEEGRSIQASVYIKKNDLTFTEYRYKATEDEDLSSFCVNLKRVEEHLTTFPENLTSFKMLYKGEGAPLVLIAESESDNLAIECSIKTRELQPLLDYEMDDQDATVMISFRGPDFFHTLNDFFRMSQSANEIQINVDAKSFKLIAHGSMESDLDYELPKDSDMIIYFTCKQTTKCEFKSSHLKLMLKTLMIATTTTISIDKNKMLGVRIMIEDDQKYQTFIEYFILSLKDSDPDDE